MTEEKQSNKTPMVALNLPGFSFSFTGLWALVPLAALLALVVLLVNWIRITSESLLWVSAVLWILFIGYWSAVAGNAAATKSAESAASRWPIGERFGSRSNTSAARLATPTMSIGVSRGLWFQG